ncbi:MAG: SusC/RagA family TonB-linked outer membrane protein [Marinilabiliales bacterium]|nr:MAG: SusC/RagA family TonB-linked outer membrane protein [Marinilabiliales bacterium]
MRKITILLAFLFFVGANIANAQTRTISGKVTSADDGMGIPGATVVIKGTTTGTTTDLDGKYTLNVEPSAEALVFSFVGMSTVEVELGNSNNIDVVLETESLLMDEVVVTALGISREKKSLGYAVQELDGSAVNQVRETNVVNSLAGKATGVDIRTASTMGGSANILIRGTASLTQNNQAMFVIDGVPVDNHNTNEDRAIAGATTTTQNDGWGGYDYGNSAMDINPDDIASVSILKGAAATALYGSRAANGVVMITTKKGKTTESGKKRLGVTINSGVQFSTADMSTTAHYQEKYGGGYGPFYENPAGTYNGVEVDAGQFFYGDVKGDGNMQLIMPTPEDASWGQAFNPALQVVNWDAIDPVASNFGEERSWVFPENSLDYFFNTGVKWTNNISIDGANENGTFRLSYTNMDEKGMLVNSSIKKNIINFAGSYNVTKKIKVEANITYNNTKAQGRYGTGYEGRNPMQALGQWFQTNVDLKTMEDKYLRADGSQLSWNSSYWASYNADGTRNIDGTDHLKPLYADNPYWIRYKNYENDSRDRIFGYTRASWEFTDFLSASVRFGLDNYSENQNERIAVSSVDQSAFGNFRRNYLETNTDMMLNFDKVFGKVTVDAFVGYSNNYRQTNSIYTTTIGGLIVPDLYTVSNSKSPVRTREWLTKRGYNSALGNVRIGYGNFIYLEASGRNDWVSTLPEGENSYFYPSASLSLLVNELGSLKDVSWLSLLKVRGNYAQVGNDAPAYSLISTYTQNTSWGDYALFSVNSTLQNPELRPERTKSYEFGIEASFFQGRLGLDIATYNSNSYDQIMPVLVSPTSGVTRRFVNGGEIENKGWEIALNGTPVQTKDFSWNVGVNWWTNKNKVLSLYEGVDNLLIYSAWDVSINASVGQPYGSIRGTDFIYTNGKKTVDANGYYMRTSSDTVIGDINPDWKMGINSTLSWKSLSLYFLVDFQKGGDIYSVNTKYGQATGLYFETAENNDKGVPMRDPVADGGGYNYPNTVFADGTANDIYVPAYRWGRAFYYNNSPTARYVFDASYVKLRELALTYRLPSKVLKNTFINNVSFSVTGRNLWIISKNVDHFDPEFQLSSGNQQGIETGSYPTARTYGFNVKIGF